MSDQLPLFFEATYSIDGYVPHFTREEAMLQLRTWKTERGRGFGVFMEEDEVDSTPVWHHSIKVLDLIIYDDPACFISNHSDSFTRAAMMANWWLKNPVHEKSNPKEWQWLKDNAEQLNRSSRYWFAVDHLNKIRQKEAEVVAIQESLVRARLVQQLLAYEVITGVKLEGDDRKRKWAEISGGLPYQAES